MNFTRSDELKLRLSKVMKQVSEGFLSNLENHTYRPSETYMLHFSETWGMYLSCANGCNVAHHPMGKFIPDLFRGYFVLGSYDLKKACTEYILSLMSRDYVRLGGKRFPILVRAEWTGSQIIFSEVHPHEKEKFLSDEKELVYFTRFTQINLDYNSREYVAKNFEDAIQTFMDLLKRNSGLEVIIEGQIDLYLCGGVEFVFRKDLDLKQARQAATFFRHALLHTKP